MSLAAVVGVVHTAVAVLVASVLAQVFLLRQELTTPLRLVRVARELPILPAAVLLPHLVATLYLAQLPLLAAAGLAVI